MNEIDKAIKVLSEIEASDWCEEQVAFDLYSRFYLVAKPVLKALREQQAGLVDLEALVHRFMNDVEIRNISSPRAVSDFSHWLAAQGYLRTPDANCQENLDGSDTIAVKRGCESCEYTGSMNITEENDGNTHPCEDCRPLEFENWRLKVALGYHSNADSYESTFPEDEEDYKALKKQATWNRLMARTLLDDKLTYECNYASFALAKRCCRHCGQEISCKKLNAFTLDGREIKGRGQTACS